MSNSKEKIFYIQGPVMFAKVFPGNLDRGKYAPQGGQFTIDIGVDAPTKKLIKSWNRRYLEKEYKPPFDDNVDPSLDYFSFKRKNVVLRRDGTEVVEWGGPPRIIDSDGEDWGNRGLIGNGSICTLKLAVYRGVNQEGQSYTTVRLDGIRVDEWVEFKPENQQDDEDDEEAPDYGDELPF